MKCTSVRRCAFVGHRHSEPTSRTLDLNSSPTPNPNPPLETLLPVPSLAQARTLTLNPSPCTPHSEPEPPGPWTLDPNPLDPGPKPLRPWTLDPGPWTQAEAAIRRRAARRQEDSSCWEDESFDQMLSKSMRSKQTFDFRLGELPEQVGACTCTCTQVHAHAHMCSMGRWSCSTRRGSKSSPQSLVRMRAASTII